MGFFPYLCIQASFCWSWSFVTRLDVYFRISSNCSSQAVLCGSTVLISCRWDSAPCQMILDRNFPFKIVPISVWQEPVALVLNAVLVHSSWKMNLCPLTEYLRAACTSASYTEILENGTLWETSWFANFFFWQLQLNIDSLALHLTDPEHLPLSQMLNERLMEIRRRL